MDLPESNESSPLLLPVPRSPSTPVTSMRTPWDPRRGKLAGGLVLAVLTFERLAFYAVLSNLYVFLTTEPSPWPSEKALSASLLLVGLAYFSALPAGWLADAVIGRYWAITGGLVFYVAGYSLLTALAADSLGPLGCDRHQAETCYPHVFVTIATIGLAVGTVKANVPPFGAEQVRDGGMSSLRVFFNWYYWCINGGSLVGIGVLSYVEQDLGKGFPVAFAVATGSLTVALLLMLFGRPAFVIHRPGGVSLLGSLLHMLREAVMGRCSTRGPVSIQSSPILTPRQSRSDDHMTSRPLTTSTEAPSWLDYAKVRYGGSHRDAAVDEVKRLGPVFLLLISLLPYWLVFLQSNSGFQAQAVHLNLHLHNFQVPTAWLGLLDQIFVLALIPIMNGIVYPALDRRGYSVSLVNRIGIGMVFAVLAVCVAGAVESVSKQTWLNGGRVKQTIGNETYYASNVSVMWQIPQYCLVGTAEVFTSVGGLELAHSLAPRSLQGLVMGLLSAMEGVASFLGLGLVSILSPSWIKPDTNHFDGHFEWFFYLLGLLELCVLLVCIVTMCVRRRRAQQQDLAPATL